MGARQEWAAKELRGVVPRSLRRLGRILRDEIADLERELRVKRLGLMAVERERNRQRLVKAYGGEANYLKLERGMRRMRRLKT